VVFLPQILFDNRVQRWCFGVKSIASSSQQAEPWLVMQISGESILFANVCSVSHNWSRGCSCDGLDFNTDQQEEEP
jgi:hypothetical protein